ncbi:AlbA family DNA-binding domain-containing protein [Niastella populi]|uniref:Schlafen AlbA-2 domain-containing protein n=1 Tax=Niastella populi TaxID=550983 RepID=A0A1V9FHN4_9BACT|nr:ATP-binding protein [Niastella populi]OQP57840.1 hypothetical protein A4R26_23310 [Niastella populi]
MYLQGKYINDITAEDIENLINNSIKENKELDYKRELNINSGKDTAKNRTNFIGDVSGMYNTDGGCIIYGIEEKKDNENKNTGYPSKIVPLEIENQDKFSQLIYQIIGAHTDPKITTIVARFILVQEKLLLIIGIPKNYGLPSMVTHESTNRFLKRNSVGNYLVSTSELNQLFLMNQSVKERASSFRLNRIKEIQETTLVPMIATAGSYFLHFIPYSFADEKQYDLIKLTELKNIYPVPKEEYYSSNYLKFNFDGLYTYQHEQGQNLVTSHIQYFRNGIIEMFSQRCCTMASNLKIFEGHVFITNLLQGIPNITEAFKKLQVEPPIMLFVSILDIKAAYLRTVGDVTYPITYNKDNLFFPPIVLNTFPLSKDEIFGELKPAFDILWQTAGEKSCPSIETFIKLPPKK